MASLGFPSDGIQTTVTGLGSNINGPSNGMLGSAGLGGNPPSDASSDPGVSTTGNLGTRSTQSNPSGLTARAVDMGLANDNLKTVVAAVVNLTDSMNKMNKLC